LGKLGSTGEQGLRSGWERPGTRVWHLHQVQAPVRPDPDPPRTTRLRTQLDARRDRASSRVAALSRNGSRADPALVALAAPGPDEPRGTKGRLELVGIVTLVALGSVALALGVAVGWRSWSQRSSVPLDEQLPFLVASADPEPSEAPHAPEAPEAAAPLLAADGSLAAPQLRVPAGADAVASPEVQAVVHVSGAVVNPGVVLLPPDSRVHEAIDLAGGPVAEADLDRINLAALVADGERVHVPTVDEEIVPVITSPAPIADEPMAPLNINVASAVSLEALPGIGPSLANAIVQTRTERGPFRSIDELLEVPGIGPAKLATFRDDVTVS